jgi:hypothetical protein
MEGMRGRAVVYEVANASDEHLQIGGPKQDEADLTDREAVELAALNQMSRTSFNGRIHVVELPTDGARAAVDENCVEDAQPDGDEAFHVLDSIELTSFNGDEIVAAPSLNDDAVERDAAFADWEASEQLAGTAESVGIANGNRDRRMLGVGAAVALSFMPWRKAWRRRGAPNAPAEPIRRR